MRVTSFTIGKKLLTNIGNYSNIEVSHYVTVEVGEGETPNYDEVYDEINRNLQVESDNLDANWIKRGETTNDWKMTIKLPKRK